MAKGRFGVFSSSQDPDKLSLTIKGILTALIPLILVIGKTNGWLLTESDLVTGIEALGAVVSGILIFWGVARKFRS